MKLSREEWIRERAYYIYLWRNALGNHISEKEDWLDAEEDWEIAMKHSRDFHKNCDLYWR